MTTTSSGWERPLNRRRRSCRTLALTLLFGLAVWLLHPARVVDTIWSDILLTNQRLPAGPEIVIVNLTARDLLANGMDRLSRVYFAESLQRLACAGATRIVIDFNLGSNLRPEEEAALSAVMSRLGPERLATGYEPDALLRPKPTLLQHATIVDLRLSADPDGRYRRICNPKESPAGDPSLWLATGQERPGPTPFDLRIDPATFPRISLAELHAPAFDLERLRDKKIVISFDQSAGKSRANLPVHGSVDRGALIAMATQSRLEGYAGRVWWSDVLGMAISFLSLGVGYWIGRRAPSVTRAAIGFLLLSVGSIGASLACVLAIGAATAPAAALSVALAGLYTSLACRLGLADLLAGFLAGNLSPEEVWLWRTKADSAGPVVLFDAVGGIKRANERACSIFGLDPAALRAGASPLAHLCMPGLGQRAGQITRDAGGCRVWELEWPHESLPLVVFHDVTSGVEQREAWQKKLITDPLTGVLNRAGFETGIKRLAQSGRRDYAIFFLDMNGFKEVNDRHGHETGDMLLKAAALRFSSVLRKQDTLARMGGDEFAVILEGELSPETLRCLCAKLERAMEAPIDLGFAVVQAGVAVGYGVPVGIHDTTADVLRRADAAMYARKALIKGKSPSTAELCVGSRWS